MRDPFVRLDFKCDKSEIIIKLNIVLELLIRGWTPCQLFVFCSILEFQVAVGARSLTINYTTSDQELRDKFGLVCIGRSLKFMCIKFPTQFLISRFIRKINKKRFNSICASFLSPPLNSGSLTILNQQSITATSKTELKYFINFSRFSLCSYLSPQLVIATDTRSVVASIWNCTRDQVVYQVEFVSTVDITRLEGIVTRARRATIEIQPNKSPTRKLVYVSIR